MAIKTRHQKIEWPNDEAVIPIGRGHSLKRVQQSHDPDTGEKYVNGV